MMCSVVGRRDELGEALYGGLPALTCILALPLLGKDFCCIC